MNSQAGRRRPLTVGRIVRGIVRYGPNAAVDALVVFVIYMLAAGVRTGGRLDQPGAMETATLALTAGVLQVFANAVFNVYWRDWSVAALEDLVALLKACAVAFALVLFIDTLREPRVIPFAALFSGGSVVLFAEAALKLQPRWGEIFRVAFSRGRFGSAEPTVIIGAGRTGQLLARDLLQHAAAVYRVVAFIDDEPRKWGTHVRGVRVAGPVADLRRCIEEFEASLVVIALARPPSDFVRKVVQQCEGTEVRIRAVSGVSIDRADTRALRPLSIDELLARDAVDLGTPVAHSFIQGRRVLITGAAGSIGSELARQVASLGPERLTMLDTSESGLFDARARLAQSHLSADILLCDVRDAGAVGRAISSLRPEIVFHAAAYKHVGILESAPSQAVLTNVIGTDNVLRACVESAVSRFVLISTDKAVSPSGVMGRTKRICELLTLAYAGAHGLRYCVVRFGNVLGSVGSVVPIFERQIDNGGPVTVTHPQATRFFMTIAEAAGLVIQAGAIARAGDLLVLDMGSPVSIMELARKMIRLRGLRTPQDVDIVVTGLHPSEKLHEEVTAPGERAEGSEHSQIIRVRGSATPDLAQLGSVVSTFDRLARTGDDDSVAAALRIAVEPNAAARLSELRERFASTGGS